MMFENTKDEVLEDEDKNEVHGCTTGSGESSVKVKHDLSSKESKEESCDGNKDFSDEKELMTHHKTRTPAQEKIDSLWKILLDDDLDSNLDLKMNEAAWLLLQSMKRERTEEEESEMKTNIC